jgi:hypothetical protein
MRLLGGGIGAAYLAQGLAGLAACVLVAVIAVRRPGVQAELALMSGATLLCSPFLLDYDLVWLAIPIAWVVARAQAGGWLGWEKIVLLTAYVLPILARPLAMAISVPIAPLVMAALLLVVARRAAGRANFSSFPGAE